MIRHGALAACAALCIAAGAPARYPAHWWTPVAGEKASWEIGPDEAAPGHVILSKRNELGLLSNFAATPFELDGQQYASVEGLWQSLLYPEGPDDPRWQAGRWPHTRAEVAALTAFEAKKAGGEAHRLLAPLGIKWVSYRGQRLDYKGADADEHYRVIRRAMQAKLLQNRAVRELLLATGNLEFEPDHRQPADKTAAYEYHRIWMELRTELRAEERRRADASLSHWSPENRARIVAAVQAALAFPERAAAFDGDGTLWHADIPREFLEFQIDQRHLLHFDYALGSGQVAGERLYGTCAEDVSICIAQAAYLHVGLSLADLQKHMDAFFANFDNKIFAGQVELIGWLREHGFSVYLVSGGPKWLAEYAGKRWFGIPPGNVIGVQTRVAGGVLSAEVVPPVPFREGKMRAIEKVIGKRIAIAAGNTHSDIPMLELAQQLAIAINSFGPETKGFHHGAEQRLKAEAEKRGWLIQQW
jgi:phosphoserine phosphatase/predicted NAD-dependent protein-ADP-ribosyltransferase YbiA (DUF1768 family)